MVDVHLEVFHYSDSGGPDNVLPWRDGLFSTVPNNPPSAKRYKSLQKHYNALC